MVDTFLNYARIAWRNYTELVNNYASDGIIEYENDNHSQFDTPGESAGTWAAGGVPLPPLL